MHLVNVGKISFLAFEVVQKRAFHHMVLYCSESLVSPLPDSNYYNEQRNKYRHGDYHWVHDDIMLSFVDIIHDLEQNDGVN